jgi:NAD(P)H dehydrogenase (quinone)
MEAQKPRVLLLFYSMHGHMYQMMLAAVEGVKEAGGEPIFRQVQELIPEEKWDDKIKKAKEMMRAVAIADPRKDLQEVDGILVGAPTRFGNMPAQMRNFWDQTGGEWMSGTLIGKPASVISSSATQHGGQETTIITTMITLLHHGMIMVGLPYSVKQQMTMDEISGGSPYGASTIVGGMGERMPSENEKLMAKEQGKRLVKIAKRLMA